MNKSKNGLPYNTVGDYNATLTLVSTTINPKKMKNKKTSGCVRGLKYTPNSSLNEYKSIFLAITSGEK